MVELSKGDRGWKAEIEKQLLLEILAVDTIIR